MIVFATYSKNPLYSSFILEFKQYTYTFNDKNTSDSLRKRIYIHIWSLTSIYKCTFEYINEPLSYMYSVSP